MSDSDQVKINRWCGSYKLDENKNSAPCSTDEWAEQLEKMVFEKTKHVADETISGKRISTIWLGIDHQWCENGPPLLLETMVFNENEESIYCERYSTWDQAELGHKVAVQWVMDGCHEECF